MPWSLAWSLKGSYAGYTSVLASNVAPIKPRFNLAAHVGARLMATTRNRQRASGLELLGAREVLLESPGLHDRVRERHPQGIDASALVTGSGDYPLAEIPFQDIVERVEDGTYKAKPSRGFDLNDIREAHRLMESSGANAKIVVRV